MTKTASGFSACTFLTNAATAAFSSSGCISWVISTPMRRALSAITWVYLARSPSTSYDVPGQPSQYGGFWRATTLITRTFGRGRNDASSISSFGFGVVWRLWRFAHPVASAAVQAAVVPRNDRLDIEQQLHGWL